MVCYYICAMERYIAYYRVSTREQGDSGLGIDAQKTRVKQFVAENEIICEFTEIESGKNDKRPILRQAMEECKKNKCKLVIAKLDRLARSMGMIVDLQREKIDFVCADMPEANKFTVHILAAMAEYERELISDRTKKALAELKATGKKLGKIENLGGPKAIAGVIAANRLRKHENYNNTAAASTIMIMREAGNSLQQIADHLNKEKVNGKKIVTATGIEGKWTPMQVSRLLK
jgi:DNA invertase Pin-like site-specific DNA recombinase